MNLTTISSYAGFSWAEYLRSKVLLYITHSLLWGAAIFQTLSVLYNDDDSLLVLSVVHFSALVYILNSRNADILFGKKRTIH